MRILHAILLATLSTPSSAAGASDGAASARHIVYLHGRIVQEQGPEAVSPEHGRYRFDDIVAALAREGAVVHAPVRDRGTTLQQGADAAKTIVDELLAAGTPAANITVVGASQGAIIAALVSDQRTEADLRYALLAGCNDWLSDTLKPRLHGHVLSIHEASDNLVGSCKRLFAGSPEAGETREVRIDTGLGHGFLYRPLDDWLRPTLRWAEGLSPAAADSERPPPVPGR